MEVTGLAFAVDVVTGTTDTQELTDSVHATSPLSAGGTRSRLVTRSERRPAAIVPMATASKENTRLCSFPVPFDPCAWSSAGVHPGVHPSAGLPACHLCIHPSFIPLTSSHHARSPPSLMAQPTACLRFLE